MVREIGTSTTTNRARAKLANKFIHWIRDKRRFPAARRAKVFQIMVRDNALVNNASFQSDKWTHTNSALFSLSVICEAKNKMNKLSFEGRSDHLPVGFKWHFNLSAIFLGGFSAQINSHDFTTHVCKRHRQYLAFEKYLFYSTHYYRYVTLLHITCIT